MIKEPRVHMLVLFYLINEMMLKFRSGLGFGKDSTPNVAVDIYSNHSSLSKDRARAYSECTRQKARKVWFFAIEVKALILRVTTAHLKNPLTSHSHFPYPWKSRITLP